MELDTNRLELDQKLQEREYEGKGSLIQPSTVYSQEPGPASATVEVARWEPTNP